MLSLRESPSDVCQEGLLPQMVSGIIYGKKENGDVEDPATENEVILWKKYIVDGLSIFSLTSRRNVLLLVKR